MWPRETPGRYAVRKETEAQKNSMYLFVFVTDIDRSLFVLSFTIDLN
jgi:hypothetical protein